MLRWHFSEALGSRIWDVLTRAAHSEIQRLYVKEGCKGLTALGHGVEHHGLLSSSEARATHRAPSLGDFGMQLLWSANVRADQAS